MGSGWPQEQPLATRGDGRGADAARARGVAAAEEDARHDEVRGGRRRPRGRKREEEAEQKEENKKKREERAEAKAKEARAKEFAKTARMEKEQVVRDLLKDAGCWTSTTGFVLAKDTAKFVKQHRAALRAVDGYASA